MNNNSLLLALIALVVVGGFAYVIGHRQADSEPSSALEHAVAGVSDKIDQMSNQAKADASSQSADDNFDAAKKDIGVE